MDTGLAYSYQHFNLGSTNLLHQSKSLAKYDDPEIPSCHLTFLWFGEDSLYAWIAACGTGNYRYRIDPSNEENQYFCFRGLYCVLDRNFNACRVLYRGYIISS